MPSTTRSAAALVAVLWGLRYLDYPPVVRRNLLSCAGQRLAELRRGRMA